MSSRRKKKPFKGKDASQDGIVAALEAVGATVQDLCRYGDVPDLLVGFRGVNYLIECKPADGDGDKRRLNLNPKQEIWHAGWTGQVAIARTPEQALAIIGATDQPTPTPRTDAAEIDFSCETLTIHTRYVRADFARELERELSAERALADRLAAWLETLLSGYDDAKEIAPFDHAEAHGADKAIEAWKEARREA